MAIFADLDEIASHPATLVIAGAVLTALLAWIGRSVSRIRSVSESTATLIHPHFQAADQNSLPSRVARLEEGQRNLGIADNETRQLLADHMRNEERQMSDIDRRLTGVETRVDELSRWFWKHPNGMDQ